MADVKLPTPQGVEKLLRDSEMSEEHKAIITEALTGKDAKENLRKLDALVGAQNDIDAAKAALGEKMGYDRSKYTISASYRTEADRAQGSVDIPTFVVRDRAGNEVEFDAHAIAGKFGEESKKYDAAVKKYFDASKAVLKAGKYELDMGNSRTYGPDLRSREDYEALEKRGSDKKREPIDYLGDQIKEFAERGQLNDSLNNKAMPPARVIDPNEPQARFDFNPKGMDRAVAVAEGRYGAPSGTAAGDPSRPDVQNTPNRPLGGPARRL